MATATFKKRNLIVMLLLTIFTIGFYFLYWLYKTKKEINKIGGDIPTFWLAIIPFVNIYFDYRYAQNFVRRVIKNDTPIYVILYFVLILFLPVIGMLVVQDALNEYGQ